MENEQNVESQDHLAHHPSNLFLNEQAFNTGLTNREFGELILNEIYTQYGIKPTIARQRLEKIRIAHGILKRAQATESVSGEKYNWAQRLMNIYQENGFSLRRTHIATGTNYNLLRKKLTKAAVICRTILIKKRDWNAGRKKRKRFDLFEWIQAAHKHFSLRVFCETINWSPKAVLDLCHQCNEAGYKVIAPKIVGADLQWLAEYDPGLGGRSFDEAKEQRIPKRRGGKEIFKRLLHQENPTKSVANKLPVRSKKKRNGIRGGGYKARGATVYKAPKAWSKSIDSYPASMQSKIRAERAAIQNWLDS
jgi:hypothetical protein